MLIFRNISCSSEFLLDIDVKDDEFLLDIDVKDDEFLILFKDCIKSLIFKTGHYYPKELFKYFLKNNYDNILKLKGNNHIDSGSSILAYLGLLSLLEKKQ